MAATRYTACWAFLALLSAAPVVSQEPELEVAPERAVAEVAPVEAAVQGMPALPELAFEEPEQNNVAVIRLPQDELLPPEIPRETLTETAIAGGNQIYFNATLGAGSVNSVLGNINVYRLGEGPQFRLGYDHRGADGFNFNDPGAGFFRQTNVLDGWVRLGSEISRLELDAGYEDERFGLQQRSPFYSVDTRIVRGGLEFTYSPETAAEAGFSLEAQDRQRVLAAGSQASDSPRENYRSVVPELWGSLEWPRFRAETRARYEGSFPSNSELDSTSAVGLSLFLEGVPLEGVVLRVQGASKYRFEDGAYFPLEGGVEYRRNPRWGIDLAGGYRVTERSPATLWQDYPVAGLWSPTGQVLAMTEEVFARGAVDISVIPGELRLGGDARWSREENAFVVAGYDESSGLYPVATATVDRFDTEVDAVVTVTPAVDVRGGWVARWDYRRLGEAEHEALAAVEYSDDRLSAGLSGRLPIVDEPVLPLLELDLRYDVARDVELQVSGRDLLSPLEDTGRTRRGLIGDDSDPFIEPGFELGLAVRVSF